MKKLDAVEHSVSCGQALGLRSGTDPNSVVKEAVLSLRPRRILMHNASLALLDALAAAMSFEG